MTEERMTEPHYVLEVTHSDRVSCSGTLRVLNADDLAAAMADWESQTAGYGPRIHRDATDPCLARWSRWNTCD